MPQKRQKVRVVKVPLRRPPLDQPQVFPRLPRLYLELMENKAKIRQDLINREYVPVAREPSAPEVQSIDQAKRTTSSSEKLVDPPAEKRDFSSRLDMLLSDDDDSVGAPPSTPGSIPSSVSGLSIDEEVGPAQSDDGNESDDSNLSQKLKELLGDDSESSGWSPESRSTSPLSRSKSVNVDKYSRHRDKRGHSVPPANAAPATDPSRARSSRRLCTETSNERS